MSVRPLFKGFALTFILYNCRKREYNLYFSLVNKYNCQKINIMEVKNMTKEIILITPLAVTRSVIFLSYICK